jgi:hypothetical protein
MSLSRNQLNEYLATIDIDGRTVLDVGVQDKPTSRLTKGVASRYDTLDIDAQWNPTFVADLNAEWSEWVSKTYSESAGNYDTVFCIEVLEHCWNPVNAIKNLVGMMREGGELYISTPFINPHHDFVDYLRYTNEWYRDVLPKVGLEVIEIKERVASAGKTQLAAFFGVEGLRVSKIRPEFGRYTYPIGYIVKAIKKTSD